MASKTKSQLFTLEIPSVSNLQIDTSLGKILGLFDLLEMQTPSKEMFSTTN